MCKGELDVRIEGYTECSGIDLKDGKSDDDDVLCF